MKTCSSYSSFFGVELNGISAQRRDRENGAFENKSDINPPSAEGLCSPWRGGPTASPMRQFAVLASRLHERSDASAALMGRIGCLHVTPPSSDVGRRKKKDASSRLILASLRLLLFILWRREKFQSLIFTKLREEAPQRCNRGFHATGIQTFTAVEFFHC